MAAQQKRRDTFVVGAVEGILLQAKKISYFYWAEQHFKPISFFFVDVWALSFLSLSIAAYVQSFLIQNTYFHILVGAFSAIRVFEYLIYLLWVLLFAKKNKGKADVRSHRRLLVLLMSNYVETIFWFATWYSMLAAHRLLEISSGPHPIAILRESIMLMVANWSGSFTNLSTFALTVVAVHDFVGLLITIVVVARVISLLPRLSSSDAYEKGRR